MGSRLHSQIHSLSQEDVVESNDLGRHFLSDGTQVAGQISVTRSGSVDEKCQFNGAVRDYLSLGA